MNLIQEFDLRIMPALHRLEDMERGKREPYWIQWNRESDEILEIAYIDVFNEAEYISFHKDVTLGEFIDTIEGMEEL